MQWQFDFTPWECVQRLYAGGQWIVAKELVTILCLTVTIVEEISLYSCKMVDNNISLFERTLHVESIHIWLVLAWWYVASHIAGSSGLRHLRHIGACMHAFTKPANVYHRIICMIRGIGMLCAACPFPLTPLFKCPSYSLAMDQNLTLDTSIIFVDTSIIRTLTPL